jgi:hypothetical protein
MPILLPYNIIFECVHSKISDWRFSYEIGDFSFWSAFFDGVFCSGLDGWRSFAGVAPGGTGHT